MTMRTRIAALEGRLGGNDEARALRRIRAMSDAELDAAIAAYEAAKAHLSDEELQAHFEAEGFSGDDLAFLMAHRIRHHGEGGQS